MRAHLEEDAGKNLHTAGNFSQVDLNRAGTPLLEIVTEPDMNSSAECRALAVQLQRIVRYLAVSQADMQKGHMRFEPNVNLVITKDGTEYKTPIAEIKNLNSFRALERSVDYEVVRQLDEFERTGKTIETGDKTTRGWDDASEVTVLQREKEAAHDYRYFPDPDLVPVEWTEESINNIKKKLCELPLHKQMRYVNEYKLSDYDAGVLTAERSTAEFFEDAVNKGGNPKRICNLLTQTGLKLANEANCNIAQLGLESGKVSQLAKMIDSGNINASAAEKVMAEMINSGGKPDIIAKKLNLTQKSDVGELEVMVDEVIAENPQAVADVASGGKKSTKAQGFLLVRLCKKPRVVPIRKWFCRFSVKN